MTLEFSSQFFSFSRKLFLSVVLFFIAFAVCFLGFQYRREKEYRIELQNIQLQNYNERLNDFLMSKPVIDLDMLNHYVRTHTMEDLRVTLINAEGVVLYDNREPNVKNFDNHLNRKEIQAAIAKGSGYSIHRQSKSVGGEYFYSARYFKDERYIIRSALPYNISLVKHLKADFHFIWFTIAVSILLIVVFYRFTHKLSTSITQLQQFALKADRGEAIDIDTVTGFPKNELGEISQHIIRIYGRLHQAKEDLYIEREKLITHLQISHEGLGVFSVDKKEILVNGLFTKYINLISDENLSHSEEVFSIPELEPITKFLENNKRPVISKEEKRMSFNIDKSGRYFSVECIIFQDNSFEISINDITKEEEQARLKKQLTQNIAHELKTPVSSIQGYLETIVNNPNLDREKMNAFLERSYAQSNRLAHLLQDISVLTRMEEAPNMLGIEEVNLTAMTQGIFNEVAMDLEEKNITTINLLPSQLSIQGNGSLLYSIFRNLTDNAIAYAGAGITLTVRCFREDDQFYYFSFSDTGVGVAPEHLSRLFERFYRVDKGRSRKMGGTGLGLAIVKNAVIQHGGTIFAKNNPGGGLEFIFTLSKQA
ncbi:MAG: sensor histidine kinase [Phocaeicola sp.]